MGNSIFRFSPILILLVLIGCATTAPPRKIPADKLFAEGEEYLAKGKNEKAELSFKKLLEEHPYSKLRAKSLLGLADAMYNQEKFEEARVEYDRFIELYPVHEEVDKAVYQKGMCYFSQMEKADRDQTNTLYALQYFENLINNHPSSKFKAKAEENISLCRKRIAENIFLIGKFYFRVGDNQAAINRFQELLEKYPDQDFLDEVTFLLGESYLREDSTSKGAEMFRLVLERFPGSKFVSRANKRLAEIKK